MSNHRSLITAGSLTLALILGACGSTTTDAATSDEPSVASLPETPVETVEPGVATPTDEDPPSEDLTPEEAQLAFEQCLEDAGVDFDFGGAIGEIIDDGAVSGIIGGDGDAPPDGTTSAVSITEGDFEAFDECNDLLSDAFGDFTPSPEQEAQFRDAELEFSRCMEEQGFDFDLSGSGGTISIGPDADFEAMEAAMSECDSIFESLNESLSEEAGE